ncbi:hypothetical protein O6H91_15G007500 [Diphasiastrum complanatum]|uniref:Uncharacterized protein n=1 Tax=Diphasiastrum complanatum TaxID=34168 RepID=A0ACC2BFQ5_DIPCM|nr:hypothetical protein O6H91_15G007500 [Diphasiastrum complanatum]
MRIGLGMGKMAVVISVDLCFVVMWMMVIVLRSCRVRAIEEDHQVGRWKERNLEGTVAFASVGRAHYAFDIYSLALPTEFASGDLTSASSDSVGAKSLSENLLTDGLSVNYNGYVVQGSEVSNFVRSNPCQEDPSTGDDLLLVYVSERSGSAQIYVNHVCRTVNSGNIASARRVQTEIEFLDSNYNSVLELGSTISMSASKRPVLRDRPSLVNGKVIYASTQEPASMSRQSWTAIYSSSLTTGSTLRLTPQNVVDFSPAVSPSGRWIAVATYEGKGWDGEIHELSTDLYIFDANDGSRRRLVARRGGWPTWADESTIYFHRRGDDGWWSIYKVIIGCDDDAVHKGPSEAERVTPPGLNVFTPAASRTGRWLAVATRRPGSEYRHVEIFDLISKSFIKITEKLAPEVHHYNPFVSPNSDLLGYHKCRGSSQGLRQLASAYVVPHLEHIQSPLRTLAIVRVDGTFPSFSPDGSLIAFIPNLDNGGVYVTRLNGQGIKKIFSGLVFGLAWDRARKGVIYTSYGEGFTPESNTVHIISIYNADQAFTSSEAFSWKKLTKEGTGNNAFPSPSPDGKWIVFRSGRSGHKNLYIMDAVDGEEGSLRRLTKGPWTDTMASWSHDGQWIAFSSDRENPGNGSFSLYFIHPDGTGLHKVLRSGSSSRHGGRVNHPFFSPDSKSLVFTSDFAGISAEPISVPHQFQPYGEIFIAKTDGTDIQRLTHNAYEDGTPSWGPVFINSSLLTGDGEVLRCDFDDVTWLKQQQSVSSLNC